MYGMLRIPRSRVARKRYRAAVLCAVLSLLVGMLLGMGSEHALGGNVSVSVRVRPTVSATFTQSGVVVLANTPWQMSAIALDGSFVAYQGGPTGVGGEPIALSEGSTLLSVVANGSD